MFDIDLSNDGDEIVECEFTREEINVLWELVDFHETCPEHIKEETFYNLLRKLTSL